jgi:hypothetical protein
MKTKLALLLICILPVLFSCKTKPKQTGTDIPIINPATADDPNPSNTDGLAAIEFKETEYNFGVVLQGEKISHDFVFTNVGKSNLIISNAKASCGCTVPRWTREPVKPGESGSIEIIFDSTGRNGKQTKNITVHTNTYPNITNLTIRCDIISR